ncbi:uncharacterized protein J7T54_001949 [Emericellopsis cladophorae]|uniref:DUF7029 domain-containing protein n=1 Tax=Emericellopsis cladophorae TaxID=2686198 RepID=A0A9P9XXS4_9HYPO|nr:uncharacterized protein J7T54_001949 [Emericellopsis cladophorae]KAI6779861.1 hypothetical protein J7T54_001949 [Emericellopsis cladophorae]
MPEQYTSLGPEGTATVSVSSTVEPPLIATTSVKASSTSTSERPAQTQPTSRRPVHKKPPIGQTTPHNTTHTFKPCSAPKVDRADPKNFVPAQNVTLAYAPPAEDKNTTTGSINMSLAFKHPAVVLENIASIRKTSCDANVLSVVFEDDAGFEEAVKDWNTGGEPFVLITGSLDEGCAAEFERGYFVVDGITSDLDNLSIQVHATPGDLPGLAGEMEMTFTSLPAATLMRRLNLSPSWSIDIAEGLEEHTTLFTDGEFIDITAEEAWFSSKLTLSGKLKYSFWGFKLQELYFDLDAAFDSSAVVSASVQAAFQEAVQYQPDDLAFSFIDVPGVVSLGPGLAFGLYVNVEASAAVDLYAGVDFSLPTGNVHLDMLDGFKTTTSGWEPDFDTFANASQSADVALDVGADLSVMLSFKLLGGLVDLSSGFTASPEFENSFHLRGAQDAAVSGNEKGMSGGVDIPKDAISCADTNGLEFVSDFLFSLKAYATKWWEQDLYSVRVPVVRYCLPF